MTDATLPAGLRHWTARHPNLDAEVSSYAFVDGGVLLNPLIGEDEHVLDGIDVRAIVLTNRHHVRSAPGLSGDGVPVHAPQVGLEEVGEVAGPLVGYEDGDPLPGGLRAIEVGGLSPDEFAVHSPGLRALAVADGVMRGDDGRLRAVPDGLMGDDPDGVRRALSTAYLRLCDEVDFDHLLLAHGDPVVGDGRERLREYARSLA